MWVIVAIAVLVVFIADMFAFDPIPFIDEIVLLIGTIGSFKKAIPTLSGKKTKNSKGSKKSKKSVDIIDVDDN